LIRWAAPRIPPRVAVVWLGLWPLLDAVASGIRIAASSDSWSLWPVLVSALIAPIAFWGGAFLLVWSVIRAFSSLRSRPLQYLLALVWLTILVLVHAYFLALWSFVFSNRRMPNPEAVVFLLDNASRVPQHLLQTAPVMTIAFACAAVLLTALTYGSIRALALPTLARRPGRAALAGGLCLVAALVSVPAGVDASPAVFAMASASEERIEVRARHDIQSLAQRSNVATPAHVDRKYPVIVILVESLRHDLLTDHPEAIPFLKSLHDRHIGFDYAYATASHSNLTDLAFWYGQYPLRGAGFEGFPVDAPWRGTSMFGAFQAAGYATAYISSQNELWGNMQNWLRTPEVDYYFHSEDFKGQTWENQDDLRGLVRLIKEGVATAGKVEDSETIATALRWIGNKSAANGFFLGMNLQNTHFSYVMPPDAKEPYQPSELGVRAVYYFWPQERKEQVRNRYLNAVYNLDRLLERFAEELKRRKLWDECLFVVLGDNGEAFHEHGFGNHSGPMYDEVVRTLAIVKPPGSSRLQSIRVAKPVSHIDIAASVPALAGLSVPESFQGRPAHDATISKPPVFMYSNAIVRQFGIVDWPWKLLLTEYPERRSELYRLDQDPAEQRNVFGEATRTASDLESRLGYWIATQRAYYAIHAYAKKVPPHFDTGGDRTTAGFGQIKRSATEMRN
jgi:arylsulfatase A-like enzyme